MVLKLDKKTMDQLMELIDEMVQEKLEEKLQEYLGDPDEGLELSEDARIKIEEALSAIKQGKKGIPLEHLAREMEINL